MPAFRASTFSYESTTTNAGIVVPVCPNAANDLLVAVVMADTGALTTFTATMPSGWKLLEETYRTVPLIVYFKIASGSDVDLDVQATTHATTNETYNGSMTSFRDVDVVTPVGTKNLDLYLESNKDSDQALGDGTTTGVAQSFVTPSADITTNARGCLARAKFYLKKVGSPTGNIVAKLYAHSGVYGTSSVPTGGGFATSNNVAASSLTTSYQLIDFVFPEAQWFQFLAATNYVIALEYSGGDASNYVHVGYDASSPTHGGNKSTYAGSWAAQSGEDVCFYTQRFSFNIGALAASDIQAMPTITTERDDSLVVYMAANSAAAATLSFVKGPVSQIHASDGAAEGHGMGWSYMKTAGTSPSDVYCTTAVAGAGVAGVLQVNPPTAGATIIPPYCQQDLCTYIDPIQGITAYDVNTALAATADTNFGTTLGSYTANDATVAALTDKGINSFHSLGQVLNATTAGQVSGAELIMGAANRFNMGTKNLLCHVYPSLPADLQRFSAISSGRGFWMGVRSNTSSGGATTGYKIWQVHGVDAPFDIGLHVPIIINTGAGNTVATSGTLDTAVICSVGFWCGGLTGLQAAMGVGSLWLMSTTVVCGGNSTEPLDINGIVNVVAKWKERVSAIQQGAKQMLLLQDVQIGNGGTNPVYLSLDGVALEFPRQYNASLKQVNYNSTDDKVSIIYYPGSTDTIIHKNGIISSPSRFKWGLHASANTSATYDFSGLSVIGAGAITLGRAISLTGLTINDYVTLDVSGLTLSDSTLKGVPAANDSLTTSASTAISSCVINVSGVTAGNRWCSVASPSIFSTCAFTGGGGHAIRITTPGTYTITGLTWTSFGADGSTGAAIFNDSGGLVTLVIASGGGVPTIKNGTDASTVITYAAVSTTVTVTDIATSSAIASAEVLVTASNGTGPMPYQKTISTLARSGAIATATTSTAHGLVSGKQALIKGATQQEYNGVYTVTVTSTTVFTYTISGTPDTPATGSPVVTGVVIFDVTNGSGIISDSRSHSADQPVTGRVRKSTGSPYYRTGTFTGTISKTAGLTVAVQMIRDD